MAGAVEEVSGAAFCAGDAEEEVAGDNTLLPAVPVPAMRQPQQPRLSATQDCGVSCSCLSLAHLILLSQNETATVCIGSDAIDAA
ncbi:hypothetical protein [Acetobacter fallax]|uniref:Uncharacterized protein n=1 Tax=Acetobacter fallax TaxID=1737473 RepID=A0ABX0KEN5_9PROT|nr:hypothetical protein [Acetobacter fallax]NHO33388.1 hypothetical protein [Acetobacter fallax]NHO37007.1 hypothetical protein [Acetobacter fallax]